MQVSLETVSCGVCGSRRFRHLFNARDYIYGNEGEWPVAQCDDCDVVYMNPRIPAAQIHQFYPPDYYTSTIGIHDPERMTWRRAAKDAAVEKYFGYRIPRRDPLHYHVLGWLMLPFTKRWTATCKYIFPIYGGRVLDVGCRNGQWLSEYRRLGWDVEGVEPDPDSAAIAQQAGHRVFVGTVLEARYPNDHFDAVTLWDALEHIDNPSEVIREIFRVVKPNGQVYISIPNFGSWYGRTFRDRWFMFTAPIHYYHYTQDTLTGLLRREGFGHIQVSFPLGDVGCRFTLRAAWRDHKARSRLLRTGIVNAFLAGLDLLLPYGHLLAMAVKPLRECP